MSIQRSELMAGPQLVDGAQWVSYDDQAFVDETETEKDACKKVIIYSLFASYDGRVHQNVIEILTGIFRRKNWASLSLARCL
jgi:hypothetical protein